MMDWLLRRGLRRGRLSRIGVSALLVFGTAACLSDQVRDDDEDTVPVTTDTTGDTGAVADAAADVGGDAAGTPDAAKDVGLEDTAAPVDVPETPDAVADIGADVASDVAADAGADAAADTSHDAGGEACLTFAGHIQPIFDASCALSGCHAGVGATLGMDLSAGNAYAATVGVPASEDGAYDRIDPGAPDSSFLYLKLLAAPPSGAQMPYGGTPLDAVSLERVRQWILAGAPETESFGTCDPGGGVATVTITGGGTLKVPVGDTLSLGAEALDAAGDPVDGVTITWKVADEPTLFVDKAGVVLGIAAGTSTVTATADGVDSDPLTIQVLAEQPAAATFSTDVIGVFDKSCALSGCHVDGTESGDLRLDRAPDQLHEKLVGQAAEGKPDMVLISQGQPAQSYLFLKLTRSQPPVGAQMPYGSAPTSAADVQLVLRWILAGAPFN